MSEIAAPPEESLAEEEEQAPARRLLVFEVGRTPFATDMDSVREIVPSQHITRLPGSPPTVSGLINLRGTIVTVLDGGVCLGKSGWSRTGGLILLAEYEERLIGIGIDDVRDIQDATAEQLSDPAPGDSLGPDVVCAAVEIGGERMLLLDIRAVVRNVLE